MFKACSRCGKIHRQGYTCRVGKVYTGGQERGQRSSTKWTEKSLDIRERSSYLCAVCQDQGIINHKSVEVHHIIKVREDESLMYDDSNLICLCQAHHKMADAGEIDADYLRFLAEKRDNE